jgi:predicted nucleotidyltransferase
VARGDLRAESDIDLAVSGCEPSQFYRLSAELERALGMPLDVVDLDRAPEDVVLIIRREGRRLYPPSAASDAK